ncbi:class I SAM-dependent methyltransferase [Abyssisolibacter fermentans]|uniref:class I SAM-dependent methyltransferase n=1 Tax=Abyssisolibacter fermentans TaxID=1766203 RepID=UPI0008311EC4|nr:class I SAM-dependent methyltransferase [Abyssisolibacter fermentans]
MLNNTDIIKEKSLKTFNAQADCYDTTFNGKHSSKIYGMVLEKLSTIKYKSILDIGCGTGNMLSMIPKKEDITFCGLDLSSEMIRVAKKKLNDDVALKIGDSENLPWDKNTFDVVLCIDSFHCYPKPI